MQSGSLILHSNKTMRNRADKTLRGVQSSSSITYRFTDYSFGRNFSTKLKSTASLLLYILSLPPRLSFWILKCPHCPKDSSIPILFDIRDIRETMEAHKMPWTLWVIIWEWTLGKILSVSIIIQTDCREENAPVFIPS